MPERSLKTLKSLVSLESSPVEAEEVPSPVKSKLPSAEFLSAFAVVHSSPRRFQASVEWAVGSPTEAGRA